MFSSSSSSSKTSSVQPKKDAQLPLPSVSCILDMTSAESSWWCSHLGIASQLLQREEQIALIDYVKAKEYRTEPTTFKLPFDKSPTTFTWAFSKAELKQCDAVTNQKFLASKQFTDRNGIVWLLRFHPKGYYHSSVQKAACFLVPLNLSVSGVRSLRVICSISHVEAGLSLTFSETVQRDAEGYGFNDFMEVPSVAPSPCPICMEHVSEMLATACDHAFCTKCTLKLLTDTTHINCPFCRRRVARSDELRTVRYTALESFTLKATVTTKLSEKNMGVAATLGDVMCIAQAQESKLDAKLAAMSEKILSRMSAQMSQMSRQSASNSPLTGSKRSFSQMSGK